MLNLVMGIVFAFIIGLSLHTSLLSLLQSPFNPSPANAYCSGWLQCGAYSYVCGSCAEGSCQAGDECDDGSACPCGDLCFAIPMQNPQCSGSQDTCGASCGGGMCDTGYASCSWTPSVSCPPGQQYCGSCINACRTTPPSCNEQIVNECGAGRPPPPDPSDPPFCGGSKMLSFAECPTLLGFPVEQRLQARIAAVSVGELAVRPLAGDADDGDAPAE